MNMKNNRLIYLILALMVMWLSIISFTMSRNRHNDTLTNVSQYNVSGFSTDFTRIIDENISAVVTVNAEGNILTGFVYRQDSDDVYVLTAYHGIAGVNSISVAFASAYTTEATLVGYDIYTDLAVLKLKSPYEVRTLKMGNSILLKQGEFIISIGTPLSVDYALSCEMGMVAKAVLSLDNSIIYDNERYSYFIDVIQLSTKIVNGYSGSPVINMSGEVVGMNTMSYSDDLCFAITANEVQIIAERIIASESFKKNNYGIKGIYIRNMQNYEKTNLNIDIDVISGLYVQRLKENSLASLAGVRPGDVITRINDTVINDLNDYLNISYADLDNIIFEVYRNGQTMTLGIEND